MWIIDAFFKKRALKEVCILKMWLNKFHTFSRYLYSFTQSIKLFDIDSKNNAFMHACKTLKVCVSNK